MAKRGIADLARKLADAEERVARLRRQLDVELSARKAAGATIAQLARETRLSRQAIYNAIKRHAR